MRLLRVSLATIATVLLAAGPASADLPEAGHFSGSDGVGVHVVPSPHSGHPYVENAHFHHYTTFERVIVHDDGTFRTCTRVGHVVFKEYCIAGHFGTPHSASGHVLVYRGVHGHVEGRPYESHPFAVTRNS